MTSHVSHAFNTPTNLASVFDEIKRNASIYPAKSIALLRQHSTYLQTASHPEKIQWWLQYASVASRLSLTDEMESALSAVSELLPETKNNTDIFRFLGYSGHLFRHIGRHSQSIVAYWCALEYIPAHYSPHAMLLSIASDYVSLSSPINNKLSRDILTILKNETHTTLPAPLAGIVDNLLAIAALRNGNFDTAAYHFRASMDAFYEGAQRADYIKAGLNLLLTYSMQGNTNKFIRLKQRLDRTLESEPLDNDAQVFYYFIQENIQVTQGNTLSQHQKDRLSNQFSTLNSNLYKDPIVEFMPHLLPSLPPTSPANSNITNVLPMWMTQHAFCDVTSLAAITHDDAIARTRNVLKNWQRQRRPE